MEAAKNVDTGLRSFETELANQLRHYSPDELFVKDLRGRLLSSRVFAQRREIGAVVVASLAVLLAGSLTCMFVFSISRAKKKFLSR